MSRKQCKNCKYRKHIYVKGLIRLWKKRGRKIKIRYYCTKREKMLTENKACEDWEKQTEIDLSPQRFEEAEQDIKYMIEFVSKLE